MRITYTLATLDLSCANSYQPEPHDEMIFEKWVDFKNPGLAGHQKVYILQTVYAEENLVTALVPSETACLASSPGNMRRTAVWISREESVAFLLYVVSLPASSAMRPKISLMNEFIMDMPFLLIPVSGWTCLRTL
jgi:hypothetical protein